MGTDIKKKKFKCKIGGKLLFHQHVLQHTWKVLPEITKYKTGSGLLMNQKNLHQISTKALKAVEVTVVDRKKIRIPRIIPFETKVGVLE